jgi:hypothetical protein
MAGIGTAAGTTAVAIVAGTVTITATVITKGMVTTATMGMGTIRAIGTNTTTATDIVTITPAIVTTAIGPVMATSPMDMVAVSLAAASPFVGNQEKCNALIELRLVSWVPAATRLCREPEKLALRGFPQHRRATALSARGL